MKKDKKILVVVHVYYLDQLDVLIECLGNITLTYDLYVTSDIKNKKIISEKIQKEKPDFNFIESENLGYDVWPFIKVINNVDLSKYDYIIQLHTKRDIQQKDIGINGLVNLGNGYFLNGGSMWRDNLLEFIKTKSNLHKCLKALENPKIGMCTRYNLIHNKPNIGGIMDDAKKHYPKYVFDIDNFNFVAGTMFISKIEPIQLIKDMNILIDLFEKPTADHKTQFAHVIERSIGESVYKLGMKIVDPFTPSEHIRAIKIKYTTLKIIRRFIQYCFCWVPLPKIRRKIKANINNYFYKHYMKKILILDNKFLTKAK